MGVMALFLVVGCAPAENGSSAAGENTEANIALGEAVIASAPASLRTQGPAPDPASFQLRKPVDGPIVRRFDPATQTARRCGVGFGASPGSDVRAAHSGDVWLHPNVVRSIHIVGPNVTTLYELVEGRTVTNGHRVQTGQIIGAVAAEQAPGGFTFCVINRAAVGRNNPGGDLNPEPYMGIN